MGVSTRSWYFIRDKYQFDGRLENNNLRKTSIAQNYVLLILPLTKFFVFHLLLWTFPVFVLFYFTLFTITEEQRPNGKFRIHLGYPKRTKTFIPTH